MVVNVVVWVCTDVCVCVWVCMDTCLCVALAVGPSAERSDMVGGGDSGDVGLASDLLSDSHKVEIQTPGTIHDIGSAFMCVLCVLFLALA